MYSADGSVTSCTTCGGQCLDQSGCFCADGTQCVPASNGECIVQTNDCCNVQPGFYWDSSAGCCTDVKMCNPSCKSDEYCETTETPYCACNTAVYSGLTPSDLKPTVDCGSGTMITAISKCKLQKLGYDYSTLHLANSSGICNYTYPDVINNTDVWKLQVQANVGWCGNIIEEDSSKIYFTNTIFINPYSGPLITKNPISYNMTCAYNLSMQTSLEFALHPIVGTVTIQPTDGTGSFTVTMAAYSDLECTIPIEENEDVVVGTVIYIGVFSPDADGSAFALKAETCYATSTNNRDDLNRVPLVTGGSADNSQVQVSVVQNGISLEDIIQISTFQFSGYPQVFIFCDVVLCSKASGCNGTQSARSAVNIPNGPEISINLRDTFSFSSSGHHIAASWALLAAFLLTLLTINPF
ncbi:pancreatic secretory granule membrane major glycoprotein GP2-like [Pseudophryne corroboree]|uniref:pancreatic secretory granule membrane major glycoprotein GP2-like n=1 Tax=Pseudophryne corroboree TaxID=495146 RepID=UPI003081FED2